MRRFVRILKRTPKLVSSLFKEHHCFDIGMCIRNARGHFMKARTVTYNGVPFTNEAEDRELMEAILWLGEMGMSNVSIELDCKLVVDVILDKSSYKPTRV